MIITLGEGRKNNMSHLIIGDADGLIALVHNDDVHHKKVQKIAKKLQNQAYSIMYPNTAFLEAITSLKRKLNLAESAELLTQQFLRGIFAIIWVDEVLQKEATQLFFDKAKSKQNTIFDCIVATCAKQQNAVGVFSFDRWYPKLGIPLVENIL